MAHSGPTVGWLLRAWRNDVAGLTASGVAAGIGVGRSAVANWEADRRRPSRSDLAAFDALCGADGVLVGLCDAATTPSALDADRTWWHQFPKGACPCWAWVRVHTAGGTVRIRARWGPLRMDVERRCGPQGVIITLPVSAPEPPVCVTIDPPGWVDFGLGRIPSTLPIPSFGAVADIRPAWPPEPTVALFARRLRPLLQLRGGWIDDLKHALGVAGGPPDPASIGRIDDLTAHTPCSPTNPSAQWPGSRYRRLREARALSRQEAARSVTALHEDEPLTAAQLEVFEQGGHPRVQHFATRLDVIYHAGGRTVLSSIEVTRRGTEAVLHPPAWWHGPLWMQPEAPEGGVDAGAITLRWGAWKKCLRLKSSAVISTGKRGGDSTGPTVTLPEGWVLRAGVGMHPAAQRIDYGWWPATIDDARDALRRHAPAYLGLFNGRVEDLRPSPVGQAGPPPHDTGS